MSQKTTLRVLGRNTQDPHHRKHAKHDTRVSPYNLLRKSTNSTDKERYDICWDPPTALGNTMLFLENNIRKHHVTHCTSGRNPEAFRSPSFFSQKSIEHGTANELHHIGLSKCETVIKQGGLVPGRPRRQQRTTTRLLFACQLHGHEP